MGAFSVENLHNGKTFENYTRFEWGVEVGVVTTFILRLFVPMSLIWKQPHCKLKLAINTAAVFCFFKNCFALWLVQKISTVTNAFLSNNQLQNTNHSYGRPRFLRVGLFVVLWALFDLEWAILITRNFETDSTNIKTYWHCFTLCRASQIIEITTTAAGIYCMCN